MFTKAISILINKGYLVTDHKPNAIRLAHNSPEGHVILLQRTEHVNTCMLWHDRKEIKLNGSNGIEYIKNNF